MRSTLRAPVAIERTKNVIPKILVTVGTSETFENEKSRLLQPTPVPELQKSDIFCSRLYGNPKWQVKLQTTS